MMASNGVRVTFPLSRSCADHFPMGGTGCELGTIPLDDLWLRTTSHLNAVDKNEDGDYLVCTARPVFAGILHADSNVR